jgi:hypothetical protein
VRFLLSILIIVLTISGCAKLQKLTNIDTINLVPIGTQELELNNLVGKPIERKLVGEKVFISYRDGVLVLENNIVTEKIPRNSRNLQFNVTVEALSSKSEKSVVKIFSGMPNMKEGSLEFNEVKNGVSFILQEHGYTVTDDHNLAEIFLPISFGISDPEVDYSTYSVPIFGYDGGSTSYSNISIGGYSGSATTTTSGKGLYLQGQSTRTVKNTSYERVLIFRALDAAEYRKQKEQELWLVRTKSTGYSGDLRLVLPALLGASQKGVNKHFSNQNTYRITNTDLSYVIPLYFLSSF